MKRIQLPIAFLTGCVSVAAIWAGTLLLSSELNGLGHEALCESAVEWQQGAADFSSIIAAERLIEEDETPALFLKLSALNTLPYETVRPQIAESALAWTEAAETWLIAMSGIRLRSALAGDDFSREDLAGAVLALDQARVRLNAASRKANAVLAGECESNVQIPLGTWSTGASGNP